MFTFVEIVLTIGVLVVLLSAVSACVCGCRNSNQKSELVGTAGVLKIHYEEEAPSPTPTTPASVKRASTQNSHRSLPEIPHPVGRHDSGDTTSEIYATVNLDQDVQAVAASTSRDHAYEHAYSKVQNENHIVEIVPDQRLNGDLPIDERDASHSGPESVVISASVAISGQLPSSQELPYITPPAHAAAAAAAAAVDNVQHFSGDSTDSAKGYTSISVREPLTNIRAKINNVVPQPHYATVSDDSDEMYAAIEGGSDTYAQIVPQEIRSLELIENRRSLDRELVATVQLHTEPTARRSAPPEMGTSSNATHSRQASSSSCTNSNGALGSPKPEKRQANSPLPPPPPAGPRAAEGSRRSPLPPTLAQRIASTGDLHINRDKIRRSLNEKHQRNNSCVSSSDFYGCNYPVDKHRYSSGELTRPLVAKELNFDIDNDDLPHYNSIDNPAHNTTDYSTDPNTSINSDQRITESPSRNLEEMYAKVMKKKAIDEQKRSSKEYANESNATPQKYREDDPGYETIDRKKNHHGYETITHKERKISQSNDPGYETVKEIKNQPNTSFSNNNLVNKLNNLMLDSGPNSLISSSDPGYEHINKMDNSASDSDPNYEVLRNQPPTPPYATIASNYKIQPTYSTVNKKKYDWSSNNNDECGLEGNYESMPHEPFYTTGSESDPNYESVRPKDPNYESVSTSEPNYESLRLKDPKYESVRSKDSSRSKDPNYESVKYMDVNKTEPPYEKLNNDVASSSGVERSDSNAGYERINVPNEREQKSSINSSDDVVTDYFQV